MCGKLSKDVKNPTTDVIGERKEGDCLGGLPLFCLK